MTRQRVTPTPIVAAPERGPRARTFRLLLLTAMDILRDGHIPSVAEVAVRAQVSRATAYRYFPSRSKLINAVVDESLGPVRSWRSTEPDGRARIKDLFETNFPRMQAFEPQLRAALQLSLEHWAKERAGLLEEEPYRRGHRKKILAHAMQPLSRQLDASSADRLKKALSVVFGIEAGVILKDIWGCSDREVIAIVRWIVDALLDAAADGPPAARRPGR
jgi:AcrR family transcriptional regulator